MTRTRTWALVWNVLRVAVAAIVLAAIVAQLARSVENAAPSALGTVFVNFFSFFTILSNGLTVGVLIWAAVWWLARGRDAVAEPRGLAVAFVCVSTYMIITGIVYNLLLRGIELPQGSEPVGWSNEVLHVVAPIFLLLDVLVGPLRRALPWRSVWAIAAFPLVWVAYTLVRGPFVTNPATHERPWYPYPFLNPANFSIGYTGVALYVIGIAAAIVAVGFGVVWVGRRRGHLVDKSQ